MSKWVRTSINMMDWSMMLQPHTAGMIQELTFL